MTKRHGKLDFSIDTQIKQAKLDELEEIYFRVAADTTI